MNDREEFEKELIKQVKLAAEKGAQKGSSRVHFKWTLISLAIIICLLIGSFLYISIELKNLKGDAKDQFSIGKDAASHDLVLKDNGVFGFTVADFSPAILEQCSKEMKLEVYKVTISDVKTITKEGLGKIKLFKKSQAITYKGTAIYTVDLSKIGEDDITVDNENMKVILKVPHAARGDINIPKEDIEYNDPEKGWLAIGDIKLTEEEHNKLELEVKEKMEKKLDEDKVDDEADRFLKLSVWEIYQPIITSVSKDYSLEVEFDE